MLITERLRLEALKTAHTDALLAYHLRNREHLKPYEPARSDDAFTRRAVREEIEHAEGFAADQRAFIFAVFERKGDDIVALVHLLHIMRGPRQDGIIAYSVDCERQGRGIATEAAQAVVRFAFDELHLHRLSTGYFPENVASGRVLRKLGFTFEGYARDYLFIDGAWHDSILVSLINKDWQPPHIS
ncbi:MAG: GNAT family N-acetyltransferase [Candidatus Eremiobacteraeota bacterium]|nr:GNAT family N-acetyltransferase [Candidatus Eremiobacteraeota bacterium]